MSETTILWLFGTVISALCIVIAGIVSWIVSHAKSCMDYRVQRAEKEGELHADMEHVKDEIGDRKTGIRGWLHELASDISPYIIRKQSERDK